MSLRALPYIAIVSLVAILTSCASAPAPVKSADASFKEAEAAYAARDYEEAIAAYKKVKESYSSPELTTQAELKIADAHFENKSYIEAAAAYEDFRKLHPSNPRAPYALYRAGLSHYHQITGIDTDQTPVKNAVVTLQSFLSLIDTGVTSTSSSSSMNSSACSRVRRRGGVSLMASSEPEARTLVSFFPLQGFTSRSLSLACWPMIMPP